MAENKDGFTDQLDQKSNFVPTPLNDKLKISSQPAADGRELNLAKQPTPGILRDIDDYLRSVYPDLTLCWYELAEVNRISYEGKVLRPAHVNLKQYWNALGSVATTNRNDPVFMETVGALAIDGWTRGQMRAGGSLTRWFKVSAAQENGLKAMLTATSPAELAAVRYFDDSWQGTSCLSVASADAKWAHLNT